MAEQISVQIAKALNSGIDKINIQLKPENLGRIEVKMEIAQDGRLTAVVTAEKPETLEQLQRDSKELAKALQESGLQTDEGSLSFNLRARDGQGEERSADSGGSSPEDDPFLVDGEAGNDGAVGALGSGYSGDIITDSRVDVRA